MSRLQDWEAGIMNRNRSIVEALEQRYQPRRVLHIDVLPHSLKRGIRILFDLYRPSHRKIVSRGLFYRLEELSPNRFHLITVEPLLSERWFLKRLEGQLGKLGFSEILLWSYLPTYVGVFRLPIFSHKVFDTVDNWIVHTRYHQWKARLERNYQTLAASADTIFTVAESLEKLFPNHRNLHWVPNGVDLERFRVESDAPLHLPPAPRLCYVGVIEQRVDLELLVWLADQRPSYSFLLAGWVWKGVDIRPLPTKSNVTFLGRISSDAVPSLLSQCSVGLVPHRSGALMDSMNPLKIYEYLAAGLPVVATGVRGFGKYPSGVQVVETKEQFLAALDICVQHPPSKEALQALVLHDTWQSRVERMWGILPTSFSTGGEGSRRGENSVH